MTGGRERVFISRQIEGEKFLSARGYKDLCSAQSMADRKTSPSTLGGHILSSQPPVFLEKEQVTADSCRA